MHYFVRHFLRQDVRSCSLWKLVRYKLNEKKVRQPDDESQCLSRFWLLLYRDPALLFFICIDFCDSLAYLPNKVGKVKSGMKNCSSRLLVNGMVAQIMP